LALFLRKYKAERESFSLHPGKLLSLDDLVFSNIEGKPIGPSTLTHNFGRIVKRAGLNARFHDLRHSYASLMLPVGVAAERHGKEWRGGLAMSAPIAQRTRAPVFGTGGRGFKSL